MSDSERKPSRDNKDKDKGDSYKSSLFVRNLVHILKIWDF